MRLQQVTSFALGCGSVIEVDFPSAFCPRYTVVRLGEDVLLETEQGRETSMPLLLLRERLRRGDCRVVDDATQDGRQQNSRWTRSA